MSLLLFSLSESSAPVAQLPVPVAIASPFAALIERVDRAAFVALGGVPVVYKPAAGGQIAITGIFDTGYVLAKTSIAEGGVESCGPTVFLRLSDLPLDPEFDDPTLTIGGFDYHVIERRPDDVGGIVLALRLVT